MVAQLAVSSFPRPGNEVSRTPQMRCSCFSLSSGAVECVYGSGEAGLRDGEGRDAQFNSPQGLAWHSGVLYVADTENHVIRKVRGPLGPLG